MTDLETRKAEALKVFYRVQTMCRNYNLAADTEIFPDLDIIRAALQPAQSAWPVR